MGATPQSHATCTWHLMAKWNSKKVAAQKCLQKTPALLTAPRQDGIMMPEMLPEFCELAERFNKTPNQFRCSLELFWKCQNETGQSFLRGRDGQVSVLWQGKWVPLSEREAE